MENRDHFSVLDYTFFVVVFAVSAGIGLYYAIKSRKTVTSIDEYLLGGRNMSLLPVCCSLIATSIAGGSMIGLPAEGYAYGSHSCLYMLSTIISAIILKIVFLPVLRELNLTSIFKYFELRFNRTVRLLASGIYVLSGLLFLPLTIYVPSLTFQRVTGVDTYVTVIVLSLLCASYTAIGGFKAVVWTDVVQFLLMMSSLVIVLIIGVQSVGGVDQVIQAADRGGRIIIADVSLSRWNTRSAFLQYFTTHVLVISYQIGLNQSGMQRFLSLPSHDKVIKALWCVACAYGVFMCLTTLLGLVVYANYEECDPAKAGLIKKVDEILPHFIQEKASLFTGFSGIFVAGMFSASLSTTSSYLNSMSGIIYEDFISRKYPNLSDRSSNRIMKIIVMILGVLQIFFVFFVEKMGTVVQITVQCIALNAGAVTTLFILGVLVPKANTKGAIMGSLTAIITILTLIIGSLGKKPDSPLPFRTDGCERPENVSVVHELTAIRSLRSSEVPHAEDSDIFWLFRLHFVYYGFVGIIAGIGVGYITSVFTKEEPVTNQKLLATFLRHEGIVEEERIM